MASSSVMRAKTLQSTCPLTAQGQSQLFLYFKQKQDPIFPMTWREDEAEQQDSATQKGVSPASLPGRWHEEKAE